MKRAKEGSLVRSEERGFLEVVRLIEASHHQALQAVNTTLIDLYWKVGEIISTRIEADWGAGVVPKLAAYIARTQPGRRGFTRLNLLKMKRFHEAYRDGPIGSSLVRQLPWPKNPLQQKLHERSLILQASEEDGL